MTYEQPGSGGYNVESSIRQWDNLKAQHGRLQPELDAATDKVAAAMRRLREVGKSELAHKLGVKITDLTVAVAECTLEGVHLSDGTLIPKIKEVEDLREKIRRIAIDADDEVRMLTSATPVGGR